LLRLMEKLSRSISYSFWSFLFSPIILIIVSFLFLLSLLIPKISSDIELKEHTKLISEIFDGSGIFKRVNKILWNASNNMFRYIINVSLFLKPFLAIIAIIQSIFLLIVGLLFFILIPLDWINSFFEKIKERLINTTRKWISKIPNNFFSFVFYSILVMFMSILILLSQIIPKISFSFETNDE